MSDTEPPIDTPLTSLALPSLGSPETGTPAPAAALIAAEADPVKTLELKPLVVEAIATVYDPEIPVNIYELGLIYGIEISGVGDVVVKMTLTAPNCPVAEIMPNEAKQKVLGVAGVRSAEIDLVFDPPWDREKMSDVAKLSLGFDLGRDVVPLSKLQRR